MTEGNLQRRDLKLACLGRLDARARIHPAGHQAKLAARYMLITPADERVGLMFEKYIGVPAHLWVDARYMSGFEPGDIAVADYPAAALYADPQQAGRYGRHAGLKAMRDLAHVDLMRLTLISVEQLDRILNHLEGNS